MVYNSPSRINSAAPLDVRFRNLGSYIKGKTVAAKKGAESGSLRIVGGWVEKAREIE